jgi:hypothetical protein
MPKGVGRCKVSLKCGTRNKCGVPKTSRGGIRSSVVHSRPPKLTPFQRQEAIQRLADGESQADVARAYNVDPAAICRAGGC